MLKTAGVTKYFVLRNTKCLIKFAKQSKLIHFFRETLMKKYSDLSTCVFV